MVRKDECVVTAFDKKGKRAQNPQVRNNTCLLAFKNEGKLWTPVVTLGT